MNRSFWKCWVVTALLVWCCSGASRAGAEDAATISLEEITRRVTEWRNSFVNLRVVWEQKTLPATTEALVDWPDPPDADSVAAFIRTEWIWADHGLDLMDRRSLPSDKSGFHSIEAFNGPKELVFRAQFETSADGTEKFKELELLGLGKGKPIIGSCPHSNDGPLLAGDGPVAAGTAFGMEVEGRGNRNRGRRALCQNRRRPTLRRRRRTYRNSLARFEPRLSGAAPSHISDHRADGRTRFHRRRVSAAGRRNLVPQTRAASNGRDRGGRRDSARRESNVCRYRGGGQRAARPGAI